MNNKLLAGAVSLCLLASFLLPACQHTPEQPIVNSGDDSVLNDKIEATAIPTPEAEEENLASIYGFPKYRKDEFSCIDTSVKVNVNMAVTVPNVKAVPVFETKPTTFSPEFVRNFAEKMHPGVTFYHKEDILTKSEIKERIERYEEDLDVESFEEFQKNYAESTGITDLDSAEQYYNQCKFCLAEYKKLLDTAPETCEPKPFDFEYHELMGYYHAVWPEFRYDYTVYNEGSEAVNDGRKFMIADGVDGDVNVNIHVMSRFDYDTTAEFTYTTDIENEKLRPLTLSKDEIIELGLDTLKKMGVEDEYVLTSPKFYYGPDLLIKPYEQYNTIYQGVLTYHRSCNGVPANDVDLQNDYDFINGNKYIKIEISNDRVASIEFMCPYEVPEVENENIELLSFDEAYDAFKRQMTVEYTKGTLSFVSTSDENNNSVPVDDGINGVDVTIDKAELVMVRIPANGGGYRYVPAWQFSGDRKLDVEPALAYHYNYYDNIVFLTINAVDGSRIAGRQAGDFHYFN